MINLPDGKVCYTLPEQVAKNAEDIYKIAQQWDPYKEQLEADFEILADYLADMSSAAVGAIAGQNIAPANVSATTSISAPSITGDSIIENMTGYSFHETGIAGLNFDYAGVVKTGNKLTIAVACSVNVSASLGNPNIGYFVLPAAVSSKIINSDLSGSPVAYEKEIQAFSTVNGTPVNLNCRIYKGATGNLNIIIYNGNSLNLNTDYIFRVEATFLLSDNLAA